MFRSASRIAARSAASVRTAAMQPLTRHSIRTVATSSRGPSAMRAAWIAGGLGAVAATGAALLATDQAECSWWPFGGGVKEDKFTPIRKAIDQIIDDNSCGPLFVRLAWHGSGTYDAKSGTGGSNGARMRFPPEKTDGANNGLDIARGLLEPVKAAFPDISYADLYTLAGATAIEHAGGPKVCWKAGRVDESDGAKGCPGRLPDATQGAQHIRDVFYRMGFNDQEIVALVGAHTLGECHKDRSGFVGPWTRDPNGFDNSFYTLLLNERWSIKRNQMPAQYEDDSGELMMLPSDIAMITDPAFRKWVEIYAKDGDLWFKDFAKAFAKLLDLGVKQQTCPVKH